MAYLFALRLLLERVSWYAQSTNRVATFTLSHIVRFELAQLRDYENRLRNLSGCAIAWECLDAAGGRIDQPSRVEQLQLADICASGIGRAFESESPEGPTDMYLRAIAPSLWRGSTNTLTSYGLKMHPWNQATQSAYPWIHTL
jgi:hypothetical protein